MKFNTKVISLTVAAILILGIGATTTFGYQKMVHLFGPINSLNRSVQPKAVSTGCDQASTTTPCSVIEAAEQAAKNTTPQIPTKPLAPTYSSLSATYTDQTSGLQLMYPKELVLSKNGDTTLTDSRDSKALAIKVCDTSSQCASQFNGKEYNSLKDFEAVNSSTYGQSAKYGTMTYKETPSQNTIFTNSNGVSVLKQYYTPKVFDDKGNDITASTCEECSVSELRYIVFKSPTNYVVLWIIAGNDEVEKIIDSVSI